MNLNEIAARYAGHESVHLESAGLDIRVRRLSLSEMQEVDRLTEVCSIGNGQNRHIHDLPRFVHTLVTRYMTDSDGNPLASADTVDAAKEWPAVLVSEVMAAFRKVNTPAEPDPN